MVESSDVQAIGDSVITRLLAAGVIQPKKERRKRTNWESILAREYVYATFPNDPAWFRHEVGAAPGQGQTNDYLRTRKWVDAIIRLPGEIKLIEFKMKPRIEAISQLENYARLFPETPEFVRYKNDKLTLRIVCTFEDADLRNMCDKHGIELDIFKPSNWEEWYSQIYLKGTDQPD